VFVGVGWVRNLIGQFVLRPRNSPTHSSALSDVMKFNFQLAIDRGKVEDPRVVKLEDCDKGGGRREVDKL
jgi:hypothetical protein